MPDAARLPRNRDSGAVSAASCDTVPLVLPALKGDSSLFSRIKPSSWTADQRSPDGSAPIRVELWTAKSLFEAGRELAATRFPEFNDAPAAPIRRLTDNQDAIRTNYLDTVMAAERDELITPAAEWLIDNYHMVEENLRQLRQGFGRSFLRHQRKVALSGGGQAPRSLLIAWYFVALTNSEVKADDLSDFLRGFQSVSTLDIAELWAVPTFLRYVLVENLRRMSDRVVTARRYRNTANAIADLVASDPDNISAIVEGRGELIFRDTVAVQLLYRLREGTADAQAALAALERRWGGQPALERAVQREYAQQSAGNVTVGNVISSLRRMGDIDWLTWFEGVSHVDRMLVGDSEFVRLDQATRAAYRSAVERTARRSRLSETEVARLALETAAGDSEGAADRGILREPRLDGRVEVGHLLVGEDRFRLQRLAGCRRTAYEMLGILIRRLGWLSLQLPLLVLTVLLLAVMTWTIPDGLPRWQVGLLLALALVPASETAMQALAFLAARWLAPRCLAGYDFRTGLPAEARTLVVIPCMITSMDAIDELADTLESHYLANPQTEIFFALLSDWADADAETLPRDQALLDHARQRIDALAEHYNHGGVRRFFLLHRRRQWSATDRVWMGWERKRGKLTELNMLLRGQTGTSFLATGPTPPEGVRYVVTLDSDTRLPRDTVAALAGKMAHPVNLPVSDEKGLVIRGHAIMQPRVTPSLTTGAEASVFQRAFSANRGLDPYVFAVSDLYQDLFGQGSFTGKGIYDVDAFQAAMTARVPENAILSHDLLEGSLARAALVSDIEVVENFPTRYANEASRQHRWMRGDWQLLPLIVTPGNGLNGLARFKMLDNLRRSLVAPGWLATSVAGWLLLPGSAAALWQLALILLMVLVPILQIDTNVLRRQYGVSWGYHIHQVLRDARISFTQFGLRLTTVADRAWSTADAIFRTLWRLAVSRRNLLEWTPSQLIGDRDDPRLAAEYRRMIASPLIGGGAILASVAVNPSALPVAVIFAALWIAAPWITFRASRSLETVDQLQISAEDKAELRRIARRIWRYFDEFVDQTTNHLPPDNYQELPAPKLAERTSPTNIGLYLMSVMSAHDFGWIGLDTALKRIEATIATLERMQRFRGHFFNWYDTRTLSVLPAPYLSSVDSGNLAGMLIALSSGLRGWAAHAPSVRVPATAGLRDTLDILRAELELLRDDRRALRDLHGAMSEAIDGYARSVAHSLPGSLADPVAAGQLISRAATIRRLAGDLHAATPRGDAAEILAWSTALVRDTADVLNPVTTRPEALDKFVLQTRLLAERARNLAFGMDFSLFVDREKSLMSIGYRTDAQALDGSRYDLLASEARLTSFLAIAKGDLGKEHWSRLGRPFAMVGHRGALLSWSGSMFEYLMPPLLLKERQGGILNLADKMAVAIQMEWGRSHGLPWGISESAFNARDRDMNYQYYAFGVPNLALKRSGGDYVVAPYASILAAQIDPQAAIRNLAALRELGAEGRFGFYDAVDFSPRRQREGANHSVVKNVMAHHHGMSMLAIGNAVLDGIHRERFHADPVVRASELLLQEKSPRDITPVTRATTAFGPGRDTLLSSGDTLTVVSDPGRAEREVALMSTGAFTMFVSSTGAGRAMLGNIALNRWSADPTRDDGGIHLLMRDIQSGEWWSATHAPCSGADERSTVIFSDHKAEFFKTANAIESRLEIIAATEGNADGRRLTLRNLSGRDRTIEVTSYGEIVLDDPASDRAHPAFSKMFVETEIRDEGALIMARRRPRDPRGQSLYMAHLVTGPDGALTPAAEAETDRRAFLGRGRSLADAAAMKSGATLSGRQGHTLDPIFAIRRHIRVPAGKSASITFWTLIADSAEDCARLATHFTRPGCFEHELRLAWTYSQVQLRHLGVSLDEAKLYRQFASLLIWPDLRLAATPQRRRDIGRQNELWPMGISGDVPILLLRIDNEADLPIIRNAMRMHTFLQSRGVLHDLVILNERPTSYAQDLQHGIQTLVDAAVHAAGQSGPHHAHAVRRDQISQGSFDTLISAARIMLHTRNGKLFEQLARLRETPPAPARLRGCGERRRDDPRPRPASRSQLEFWNGFGGFASDGREYVLRITHDRQTPHPWINVIARDDFGFHVSAEGASYTWAVNSRDYRITPWTNDPVINAPGETILVHDPETGCVASPFLATSEPGDAVFEAAHGLGYSRFTADYGWVVVEAVMTLARDVPARLTRLRVTNRTRRHLRLRGVAYAQLVLGTDAAVAGPMVRTGFDTGLAAAIGRNPYSADFADRITALACDREVDAHCGSRTAFLGREGAISYPAALESWPRPAAQGGGGAQDVEAAGDPCAAIRWPLSVAPGETAETTLILANGDAETLPRVLAAARSPGAFDAAMNAARDEWDSVLGTLQIDTPDDKLNLLVNTWLPYQALACRIRARTAFYQASGAFGFRDQLQDTSALILQDPSLCRRQILKAAGRQFTSGDVQHWWLPRTGAGVRTTISDDVVWLGHVTALYIAATGDRAILDEPVEYLSGPELEQGEHDRFFVPDSSGLRSPLYDHCARALDLAVARTGRNGLPLILGGDWNDGMNRVGEAGQGESVWLGWFLCATIDAFAPLAEARGDAARAAAWSAHRQSVAAALDKAGWDGAWYRRGYFDDGTPLGSADSDECRIDSIAQSWALISGAGREDRAQQGVAQALSHLFDREARIMRLFTPAFRDTPREPGYIKSYPPGVRENGGQYTHAAAWMVYALALSGDGNRAHGLFDALNPITHSHDPSAAEVYRVEPYVVAADVYGARDKLGRGGWTWYTGSAGWMYRAAVEGILGIARRPGGFAVDPRLPDEWPGYEATLCLDGKTRRIAVDRDGEDGELRIRVDGTGVAAGATIG